MAKKIDNVQNGDIKSNIITLRSVFGKVGQKYFIQPQRNAMGRFPDCVKRVNSQGDIILTPEELEKESKGEAAFIREDKVFVIEDGTTYNLDDVYERAIWEAIQDCPFIAKNRYAKDDNGNYLIDGTVDPKSKKPRYGVAELYVDFPGKDSEIRVSKKKLTIEASNYIINDERGYEGRVMVARVLGRNMTNQPNADVEDYLLSIAEKNPKKIIECYTGGEMSLRMLFIEALENGVIYKKDGLYLYGEEGKVVLGATDNAVINWMKQSKNAKTLAMIRKDTFSDLLQDE